MAMRRTIVFIALALLSLGACADDPYEPGAWSDPTTIPYAPSLGINLAEMERTESGLYYKDTRVGDGALAAVDDSVKIHYIGWFPDGRQFDNSRQGSGQPLEFKVGAGPVIAGIHEGVVGMRVGGVRKLVIPPALAYGPWGDETGTIPPYSTLVFEIELIEVVLTQ